MYTFDAENVYSKSISLCIICQVTDGCHMVLSSYLVLQKMLCASMHLNMLNMYSGHFSSLTYDMPSTLETTYHST